MKRKWKEEEVEVKYKGVYQMKSGKFGAAISDPTRSHGTIWLGSFTSATEAAKAYDKAAIKFRGSKAILNFPLPSGISPEESPKTAITNTSVRLSQSPSTENPKCIDLKEAWGQLFGIVGRKPSNQMQFINDDDDDDDKDVNDDDDGDGSASEHRLHSSHFGNQETENATRFKEFVINENGTEERALKRLKTSSVNQVGKYSINAARSVINRMVDEGLMVSCSELWCFAISLCEDEVKRALFLCLPDDDGRVAWLQYKQDISS